MKGTSYLPFSFIWPVLGLQDFAEPLTWLTRGLAIAGLGQKAQIESSAGEELQLGCIPEFLTEWGVMDT